MLALDARGPGEVNSRGHGRDVRLQHHSHPRRRRARPRPPPAAELRPVCHDAYSRHYGFSIPSCCKNERLHSSLNTFSVPPSFHLHFSSVRLWHILFSRVNTSPNGGAT